MKNEKETKERLLVSAKQEFLEKGYLKASLRNICKNAGVTTGALYFFFEDKEDLFASVVEEPLQRLYDVMGSHYQEEIQQMDAGNFIGENFNGDRETSMQIIHYLYQYFDEFLLILTKSQGTRFENSVDQFVEITEKHYRKLADKLSEQTKTARIEDYTLHWLSHMHIDIFVHMLTHEPSEQMAQKNMELIIRYLIPGWLGLFGIEWSELVRKGNTTKK